jgi:surface polysaccharide O-acyltransferase-like enzyme
MENFLSMWHMYIYTHTYKLINSLITRRNIYEIMKILLHAGILICAFNLSMKFTTKFEFKFEI